MGHFDPFRRSRWFKFPAVQVLIIESELRKENGKHLGLNSTFRHLPQHFLVSVNVSIVSQWSHTLSSSIHYEKNGF